MEQIKTQKLQEIVNKGRNTITNKTENSFVKTQIFDFEKVDINSESENTILFLSIEEAVNVIYESGVTVTKTEIENVLKSKLGNIQTEFRLSFF